MLVARPMRDSRDHDLQSELRSVDALILVALPGEVPGGGRRHPLSVVYSRAPRLMDAIGEVAVRRVLRDVEALYGSAAGRGDFWSTLQLSLVARAFSRPLTTSWPFIKSAFLPERAQDEPMGRRRYRQPVSSTGKRTSFSRRYGRRCACASEQRHSTSTSTLTAGAGTVWRFSHSQYTRRT